MGVRADIEEAMAVMRIGAVIFGRAAAICWFEMSCF